MGAIRILRILTNELDYYVFVPIIYIITVFTTLTSYKTSTIKGLRTVKRIANKVGYEAKEKGYGTRHTQVKYAELDSHADTTCLGSTSVPIYFTGEECDVSPYLSEYEPMKGIKIASAVTAYDNEDTGETVIINVNQGLYFGERLD